MVGIRQIIGLLGCLLLFLMCLAETKAQVVINELMVYPGSPTPNDPKGIMRANSFYSECAKFGGDPTETWEWVELYNTSPCDSVDISCFTLAANNDNVPNICGTSFSEINAGAFTFPRGTKIPPLGFITVGGVNGGKNSTFNLNDYKANGFLCAGSRWFLDNKFGWIALYDRNANALDAVYWGSDAHASADIIRTNNAFNRDVSTNCTCNGSGTVVSFPSARSLNSMSKITFLGTIANDAFSNGKAQFFREPDGGSWRTNDRTPSPNRCNLNCIEPGELVRIVPPARVICPGDSVLLTALPFNPAYTDIQYSWRSDPPGVAGNTQSVAFFLNKSATIYLTTRKGTCTDEDTAVVKVLDEPSPSFTINPWRICAGDTTIINYNAPAVPNVRYEWTFDGGRAIPGIGPGPHKVVWNSPGTKTVGLLVRNDECSSDYRYEAVDVMPSPIASYTVNKDTLCGDESLVVTFTGEAGNSAVFSWSFDGGTATPGTGRGPHTVKWNTTGNKLITLSVRENNCNSPQIVRNIWVGNGANAQFSVQPRPVCMGDSATITLVGNPTNGAQYVWDFADGKGVPGIGSGRQRVKWNTVGRKTVRLTVTVPGCPPQSTTQTIDVRQSPEAELIAEPETVCVGQRATLRPNIKDGNNIAWQFDGGSANPGSGTGNQSITWDSPGTKTVRLSVGDGNCTVMREVNIVVRPQPTADFEVTPKSVCAGESVTIRFRGFAPNNPNFIWDFAGATADPGTGTGPHTLTWNTSGKKIIRLRLEDGDCQSEPFIDSVTVRGAPQATFSIQPNPVCVGSPATILYTGDSPPNALYSWDFANGTIITQEENRRYLVRWSQESTPTVSLSVAEANCFSDTVRQRINVFSVPEASFRLFPDSLCAGDTATIQFTGRATANATFDWQADGATIVERLDNQTLKVIWRNEGDKLVTLSINDRGCLSNTVSRNVFVRFAPTADFTIQPTSLCEGDTVSVSYTGTGTEFADLSWNVAGGTRLPGGSLRNFKVIWQGTGSKTINLEAKEGICSARTSNQRILITPYPIPQFTLAPNPACIGEEVLLTFTGTAQDNATYSWDFGSGVGGTAGKGPHRLKWSQAGQYPLSVSVVQNGCASVPIFQTMTIKPTPSAEFRVEPNNVCENEPIRLIYSGKREGRMRFIWQSEGANRPQDTAFAPEPISYPTFGTKNITLLVERDDCPSEPFSLNINVKKIPTADFIISRPNVCSQDTFQLQYTGQAGANAVLNWMTGNAQVVNATNPRKITLFFPDSGEKMIQLQVTDQGCLSPIVAQKVNILPIPTASFKASKKVLCKGETVEISFNGYAPKGSIYEWDFGNQSVTYNPNPQGIHKVKLDSVGTFTFRLRLINGECTSSLFENEVKVINPTADFELSSPICLNEEATLVLTGNLPDDTRLIWNIQNGKIVKAEMPTYKLKFSRPGIHQVSLQVASESCVSRPFSRRIKVFDFPRATATVEPDSGRAPLTVQFHAKIDTTDVIRTWFFDDGTPAETILQNPEHRYGSHGIFEPTLLLTNSANCSTIIKLKVQVATREIFIPNAFSPNGDENNDKFLIFNLPGVAKYHFEVFNRWGEKVFETSDINRFWDGTFNGMPVPEGAYTYHLVAEEYDGFVFTKVGTITLVR